MKIKNSQAWKFIYWPAVWFVALWPWHVPVEESFGAFKILGLLVMAYGLLVHIIAGKTLKRHGHSAQSRTIWPDRLVTMGIYSRMRHPQHLGLMLIPLGIALMISTFQALLAAGWTVAAALFFILVIEEPECVAKFKTSYFQYMENTPAFSIHPETIIYGIRFLKGPTEE